MPAPKSKGTCNQCRARKVRCPGGPPPCVNCKRLDFDCTFDNNVLAPSSSISLDKKRGTRACTQCRSLKSKCTGEQPSCSSCLASGKTCSYVESKRVSRRMTKTKMTTPPQQQHIHHPQQHTYQTQQPYSQSPVSATISMSTFNAPSVCASTTSPRSSRREDPGSASNISTVSSKTHSLLTQHLPPLRDRLHLINDYFRYLFPTPYFSFLYEEATVQRCLEETMDETLMYAICAITAALLEYSRYHSAATSAWAAKVEETIWRNIEHPTIPRIQALLLIVHYRIYTGNFQRAFMLFAIASRAATALRLNYERTDVSLVTQEIRRRLTWSLTLTDSHLSIGLPEAEACPFEALHLKLPCPEEAFNADASDGDQITPGLDGVAENGLFAHCVEQYRVRKDLSRLRRELQISQQPVLALESMINNLMSVLDRMPQASYSTAELQSYSRSRWMSRYVVYHLGWHQSHCDAYRLFLRGYPEAAPNVVLDSVSESYIADAVAACLYHAHQIIKILQDVATLKPTLRVCCIEPAISGYHASRLLLFISTSDQNPIDSDNTTASSLERSQSTLTILQMMHSSSALGQLIVNELQRIIQATISGHDHMSSRNSSDLEQDASSRPPQYARAAKKYQGLGAHSILRNARFLDDSAQAAERSVNPSGQHTVDGDMDENFENPSIPRQEVFDTTWRQDDQSADTILGIDRLPFVGAGFEASPGEQLTIIPEGTFDYALFGSDPWFSWPQETGTGLDSRIPSKDSGYL